jgi:xanthine dehydrogenase YagR molybdenum-binding subunit
VPLDTIEVVLGDTSLPDGPISGGSMVTGSLVPAVYAAADRAIESLMQVATTTPGSPFENRKSDELPLEGGRLFVKTNGAAKAVPFTGVLSRANVQHVTGSGKGEATFGNPTPRISTHSFGCYFVEVTWQPEIACLRVGRVVTVINAGRIVNPLAGRNQVEGAVVMGIGMALLEHTHYDPQFGADQQQPRRLHGRGERQRPPDRRALPRLRRPGDQRARRPRHRRNRLGGICRCSHGNGPPCDRVRVRELPVRIKHLIA